MAGTDYTSFNRELLESLEPEARQECLSRLEKLLSTRLKPYQNHNNYWKEVGQIIADLKNVGHDLWNHDLDGQSQLWGWDYMRPDNAGYLQLQFDSDGKVTTFWRTENPQLSVV